MCVLNAHPEQPVGNSLQGTGNALGDAGRADRKPLQGPHGEVMVVWPISMGLPCADGVSSM